MRIGAVLEEEIGVTHASDVVKRIRELGLVLVVRAEKADAGLMAAIRAVVEAGVGAVEITFTVPDAVSVIAAVKKELGERILLGAGTVLNPSDAVAAVNAGAAFVVSPGTNTEVIDMAHRLGAAALPGAFTPTEVMTAWGAGADMVKIFPASLGGPEYIKALRGPFPDIPFLPTGGVEAANVSEFLRAGAAAVAAGGNLFDKKMVASGDLAGLKRRAGEFLAAIGNARA